MPTALILATTHKIGTPAYVGLALILILAAVIVISRLSKRRSGGRSSAAGDAENNAWDSTNLLAEQAFGDDVAYGDTMSPPADEVDVAAPLAWDQATQPVAPVETQPAPAAAAKVGVPAAPAGWHADPKNPQRQLYWDGSRWTRQARWDGSRWVEVTNAA
jgi:hypothetical protein